MTRQREAFFRNGPFKFTILLLKVQKYKISQSSCFLLPQRPGVRPLSVHYVLDMQNNAVNSFCLAATESLMLFSVTPPECPRTPGERTAIGGCKGESWSEMNPIAAAGRNGRNFNLSKSAGEKRKGGKKRGSNALELV